MISQWIATLRKIERKREEKKGTQSIKRETRHTRDFQNKTKCESIRERINRRKVKKKKRIKKKFGARNARGVEAQGESIAPTHNTTTLPAS